VGCGEERWDDDEERWDDDEEGAEVGKGALSGTLLAKSSREGISGGSRGGSWIKRQNKVRLNIQ
jgi:hypothetical protein